MVQRNIHNDNSKEIFFLCLIENSYFILKEMMLQRGQLISAVKFSLLLFITFTLKFANINTNQYNYY